MNWRRLLPASTLVVATIAFVALSAGAAFAGQAADKYEPDNTWHQARSLPSVSFHTFTAGNYDDWAKFTVTATDTPWVIDTLSVGAYTDTEIYIYDSAGVLTDTSLASNDDSDWWDRTLSSSMLFRPPHRGTFYVRVNDDDDQIGSYLLFLNRGIGRRIGGSTSADVAVSASRLQWSDTTNPEEGTDEGPDSVVACNSAYPADAVLAAGLAERLDTTVLFCGKTSISKATLGEVNRLLMSDFWDDQHTTVYVIGSSSHVSSAVIKKLNAVNSVYQVKRISAADNNALSVLIAKGNSGAWENVATGSNPVFLANGAATAPGLLAQTLAGSNRGPFFFVNKTGVPASVQTALLAMTPSDVYIIGGTDTVGSAVTAWLATNVPGAAVHRTSASDSSALSVAVASLGRTKGWVDENAMVLIGSKGLVMGACGVPMVAQGGHPLLITSSTSLSSPVKAFIGDSGILNQVSYALGTTKSISPATFDKWRLWYHLPLAPL